MGGITGSLDVLLVVPTVGAARDALSSDLAAALCQQLGVGVLSPLAGESAFSRDCQEFGLSPLEEFELITVDGLRGRVRGRLDRIVKWTNHMALAESGHAETVEIERERLRRSRPGTYYRQRIAWGAGFRSRSVHRMLRWGLDAMTPNGNGAALYRLQPHVVVVLDVFRPELGPLFTTLRRVGAPSIGVIQSWDNLTAKGYLPHDFDRLVVWSEIMRREACALYDWLDPDDVAVTGALQFETERFSTPGKTRAEFLRSIGASPADRVVTFMLSYPDLVPGQSHHLELLVRALREGAFPEPVRLIVRPQPGPRSEHVYEELERLEANVFIDRASRHPSTGVTWAHMKRDLAALGTLLAHTDVLVNYMSTTTIDAAIMNVPNVSIAFDGGAPRPYHSSIKRYLDRSHYKPLAACGGNRICMDPDAVISAISAYLRDPGLDRAGRQRIVERIAGLDKRSAGERAAGAILGFLPALRLPA
jgi:hypothetical protein